MPRIKHRTILTVCYAAGPRISEAVHLMPVDIDSQRMVIRIEQGKGRKDRLWAMAHNRSYVPRTQTEPTATGPWE